jgi:hypothetical protein
MAMQGRCNPLATDRLQLYPSHPSYAALVVSSMKMLLLLLLLLSCALCVCACVSMAPSSLLWCGSSCCQSSTQQGLKARHRPATRLHQRGWSSQCQRVGVAHFASLVVYCTCITLVSHVPLQAQHAGKVHCMQQYPPGRVGAKNLQAGCRAQHANMDEATGQTRACSTAAARK